MDLRKLTHGPKHPRKNFALHFLKLLPVSYYPYFFSVFNAFINEAQVNSIIKINGNAAAMEIV